MKQPRVPEYREADGTGKYLKTLILFLKDFCFEAWKQIQTLMGKAGSLEAKAGKADTLGGKEPEYYIQPRNLLDNSNFEIAQAGYNGKHGTVTYACDRWVASGETVVTKTASGLLLPADVKIRQKLTGLAGKTLTLAAKGTAGVTKRISFVNADYEGLESEWFSEGIGVCTYTIQSSEDEIWIYINNESGDNATFEWAVLYEGTYTADNLPPYVPKGYAVELAECQRYYYQSWDSSAWDGKTVQINSIVGFLVREAFTAFRLGGVELPVTMRKRPTIEFYTSRGVADAVGLYSDGTQYITRIDPVYWNNKAFIPGNPNSEFAKGTMYGFHYSASADL